MMSRRRGPGEVGDYFALRPLFFLFAAPAKAILLVCINSPMYLQSMLVLSMNTSRDA